MLDAEEGQTPKVIAERVGLSVGRAGKKPEGARGILAALLEAGLADHDNGAWTATTADLTDVATDRGVDALLLARSRRIAAERAAWRAAVADAPEVGDLDAELVALRAAERDVEASVTVPAAVGLTA
ncbi:hypothetical protein [Rhodococcus sp. PSBB049]|uniref:hypothetical protein n=1 Tax=Rhodococcus sp. PSBB049 TaxID=2812863 RepID=UPI001980A500|nr:hypothetical protein [Rhodococcus sp. PSBB049]QSE72199.1 hypothetical protein JYA91_27900 [Rhodococcus sp. PSBB049]